MFFPTKPEALKVVYLIKTTIHMQSHYEGRVKEGVLCYLADSKVCQQLDEVYTYSYRQINLFTR